MDWEKAKRIFIYLLVWLNLGLLGVNYFSANKSTLSSAEESAVYKVMEDRNVGLYAEIIKKTPPMRALNINANSLDIDTFKEMFFGEEEAKITLAFDKTVLASNTKSLILKDNNITFLNPEGTGALETFTKETALSTAEAFLEKISMDGAQNIKLESAVFENDAYMFEYNERFKGHKIFSNVKKITVSQKGVTMVSAAYYTAKEFVGERRDIYSCDEILLTFLEEIRKENRTEPVYIEKIELGYDFQNSKDIADGSRLRLVPCYRIFVSGSSKAYIINAYTNEIKED